MKKKYFIDNLKNFIIIFFEDRDCNPNSRTLLLSSLNFKGYQKEIEMTKLIDLTNKKFGRLLVIKRIENHVQPNGSIKSQWLCRCDCGNEIVVLGYNLKNGHTKSCGCIMSDKKLKHWWHETDLYGVFHSMISRCFNKSHKQYNDYGRRGISVCDEWRKSFPAFFEWAKNNGYKKGLSLDRIDNNGNYCPENCRWATTYQQANNKRNNIVFIVNGIKDTLPNLARKFNLNSKMLYSRYYRNKDVKYVFKEVFNG